jgi:hypothetical protein
VGKQTSRWKYTDFAAAWEAQALFDAVVFTLTVMKTVKMRKTLNTTINPKGMGLLDILLRDGK